MRTSESIVKISQALVKSQSAMGNASKDSNNPFFKSKYADLNAIREACIPEANFTTPPTPLTSHQSFVWWLIRGKNQLNSRLSQGEIDFSVYSP